MLPSQLRAEQFAAYPAEARQLAVQNLPLLRQLPIGFLPLFLRELIVYDYKFPAERREIDHQFVYLKSFPSEDLQRTMASFAGLRISAELERLDWVNSPGLFSEQMSAHLWATHQIDGFRAAAVAYVDKLNASLRPEPLPVARLGIVVIGQGVDAPQYRLFRKLRPEGVYYKKVNPARGHAAILNAVHKRVNGHPLPYAHWYIDGGTPLPESAPAPGLTRMSYAALQPVRTALLEKMRAAFSSNIGSEAVRTVLAQLRPEDLGLSGDSGDAALNHFQISVLTEGAGAQIYSTTFVQWAAREVLRRAQPITLLARYAPRQRERSMNEMLDPKSANNAGLDPEGSLIDADMGAYYTWVNQQRLPGAEHSAFVVWFENHNEAIAVSPSLARGSESDTPVDLEQLLSRL